MKRLGSSPMTSTHSDGFTRLLQTDNYSKTQREDFESDTLFLNQGPVSEPRERKERQDTVPFF